MDNQSFDSIMGIGTDIIEIKRIQGTFERHGTRFLDRIFTQNEKNYCLSFQNSFPHFAVRFAAKEAITKSLGTGINKNVSWKDLEIINNDNGKPVVKLSIKLINRYGSVHFLLSMSHCNAYATATAICLSSHLLSLSQIAIS